MIKITRRLARELHAVFRRGVLGLPPRGPLPPLALRAEGGRLRAQYRHGRLAVEHAGPHPPGPPALLLLPPEALADCEGRDDSQVALESSAPGWATARWAERGVPQARDFSLSDQGTAAEMPRPPGTWAEAPGELLDALADAARVAGGPGRYALDCLRVGGNPGGVAASC